MNESQKLMITIGVFSGVSLILLVWLFITVRAIGYEPFRHEESLREKIDIAQQKENALKTENTVKRAQVKEELDRLEKDRDFVNQLLPREHKPEELVDFITKKAIKTDVNLMRIVPKKEKKRSRRRGGSADPYEEWIYNMEIVGTYDQIAAFINEMEEFLIKDESTGATETRYFDVKKLDIEAEEDGLVESGIPDKVIEQRIASAASQGKKAKDLKLGLHLAKMEMRTYRYIPPETKK